MVFTDILWFFISLFRFLRELLLPFLLVWICGYIISTFLLKVPRVRLMAQKSCEGNFILQHWMLYTDIDYLLSRATVQPRLEMVSLARECTPRDNSQLMSVFWNIVFRLWEFCVWIFSQFFLFLAVYLTPIICCAMYFLLVTVRLVLSWVGITTHAGLFQVIWYGVQQCTNWWQRYFNASVHSVLI